MTEILFEDLESTANLLCSFIFDGTVGSDEASEITKMLDLNKIEISELHEMGAAGGVLCTLDTKTCETGSEFWPPNLPYKAELMLDTEDGLFYDLILLNANAKGIGYYVLCLVLTVKVEDLCEITSDEAWQNVSNAANDVEGLGAIAPEGEERCLAENDSENPALTMLTSGASLAVSE